MCLALGACMPSQWDYLVKAQDQAKEEEIRDRLGVPYAIKTFKDRTTSWIYRYEVKHSLIQRRGDMIGGAPCMEYELTFDEQEVLRAWVRRPCERTGEKLSPM
jgi:hypothetical protein